MQSHADYRLSQLDELESESIHIFREVAAEFEHPVLLFSGGKDSAVMPTMPTPLTVIVIARTAETGTVRSRAVPTAVTAA